MIASLRQRKPEIVMTRVGRLALWLELLSLTLVDRLSSSIIKQVKGRRSA
jgi:hypothetical protein